MLRLRLGAPSVGEVTEDGPRRLTTHSDPLAEQTSLFHLGTEAAALEQNSIISLFLFVCLFI